jgi:hypothetical protein
MFVIVMNLLQLLAPFEAMTVFAAVLTEAKAGTNPRTNQNLDQATPSCNSLSFPSLGDPENLVTGASPAEVTYPCRATPAPWFMVFHLALHAALGFFIPFSLHHHRGYRFVFFHLINKHPISLPLGPARMLRTNVLQKSGVVLPVPRLSQRSPSFWLNWIHSI